MEIVEARGDMTLGSLFDGIGGFPLAASRFGIKPIWASEIEPLPISITKRHFPNMKHLGDIKKIKGVEIEPVDIITFGSPCQDLSIAGKREGLEGERSGLLLEAIRIIKEMINATNGKYPTRLIWENVPGTFSSNAGEDFRIVLQELAAIGAGEGTSIPRPSQGDGNIVWFNAGAVVGDGWSIAWRVLDAQYWGVPQRRRRIFLVADFTGQRAAEILFKPDCLSGNSAESGAQGEETAGNTGDSVKTPVYYIATKQISQSVEENLSPTIMANDYKEPNAVICFKPGAASRVGGHVYDDNVSGTLRANAGDNQFAVVIGADGHNQNLTHNVVNTLRGGRVDKDNIGLVILNDQGGSNLDVEKSDISPCLRSETHSNLPIVYDARGNGDGKIVNTLIGDHQNRITDYTSIIFNKYRFAEYQKGVGTLRANASVTEAPLVVNLKVRRLTPLECERLQGFPDGWTEYGIQAEQYKRSLNKGRKRTGLPESELLQKISDSARYKALGNSVAMPCVLFILQRIKEVA